MLKAKIFRSKVLALGWLLIMCILFFLPGKAFPEENWMSAVYFDKWVHVGLFAVLVFLWSSAFDLDLPKNSGYLVGAVVLYGVAVEFIQRDWVANRSFDVFDILADTVGALTGLVIWLRVYRKK